MRVLVRKYLLGNSHRNAGHIPNTDNRPLCGQHLNLALWEIRDLEVSEYRSVCYQCNRIQRRQMALQELLTD